MRDLSWMAGFVTRRSMLSSLALVVLTAAVPPWALSAPGIRTEGGPFVANVVTGAVHLDTLTVTNVGDMPLKYGAVVNAGDESWLRFDANRTSINGLLAPGSSDLITVRLSAPGIDCSITQHVGGFTIVHDDPLRNPLAFDAVVNVDLAPDVWVDPAFVTFGIHHNPAEFVPQPVTIYNVGCTPLVVLEIWNDYPMIFQLPLHLHLPITIDPGDHDSFLVAFFSPSTGSMSRTCTSGPTTPTNPSSTSQMDGGWTRAPDKATVTEAETWGAIKTRFR